MHVIVRCGGWDGNQFSECGKIQSSKCQPTLMHIALSHLPESIEAPESHSLQKLTWEQPVNIVMSLVYEPTHMCHVTCTWERVGGGAWARWGRGGTVALCLPPVERGVVTGVVRWHWPPAPSQYYTHPLHSFLSSIVTADGLTWSNE